MRRQGGIVVGRHLPLQGGVGLRPDLRWPTRARSIGQRLAAPVPGHPALKCPRGNAIGTHDLGATLPALNGSDGSFTEIGGDSVLHPRIVSYRHNFRHGL
jgi:hypothetical protein